MRDRERKVTLIGPNCPGVISPGKANVGIIPGEVCTEGPVGVVSRSGTLVYQIVHDLTTHGIGQSTCVGIGGDPIPGSDFIDVLEKFEADPETEQVVLVGEIGGDAEERAAAWAKANMSKPVVAYFAGRDAPPGQAHGSCRGDRVRLARARGRRRRRHSRRRAIRSPRTRPRSDSS